jgi:surfeit locus 1 family protein
MTRTRGVWVTGACVLAAAAVLVALGTWQVERKAWKEGLIAAVDQRVAAPPSPLPPVAQWSSLNAQADEFRRVAFAARFLNDREALVYTTGSGLRPDVAGVGYWVFTPARLADGRVVMVDRGFVPEGSRDPGTRAEGQVGGETELVGVLRWPEAPGLFTPAPDPAANLWFARDPAAMAVTKGLGAVAPFYVEQESPVPPGGLPRPGRLRPNLPNNHMGYAITWYGLAAALLAVFGVRLFGRGFARRPGDEPAV